MGVSRRRPSCPVSLSHLTLYHVSAPGIRFGFTGDTVAVTFGDITISSTLVAYRLSGLDWAFTNVTAGATHLFISPETEGINPTGTISPHTFEMRVTNWEYGVQIDKVHIAEGHKLVKLPARRGALSLSGTASRRACVTRTKRSRASLTVLVRDSGTRSTQSRPSQVFAFPTKSAGEPLEDRVISGSTPWTRAGVLRRSGEVSWSIRII